MSLEGEVVVRLPWNGRRVERADVRVVRAFAGTRLLKGQPPDVVLATVPRLFSLCSQAQGAAVSCALAAAGVAMKAPHDPLTVTLEAAREHVWRLLIDAPLAMGHEGDVAAVAVARRGIHEMAGVAQSSVYGMRPAAWLELPDLDAWIERGTTLPARLVGELRRDLPQLGRSDVALMPDATREAISAAIVPELTRMGFAETPTWNGAVVETGPLARMRSQPFVAALLERDGNTVASHMVARLAELATLLQSLDGGGNGGLRWVDGFALEPGEGLAAVQTARGLLLHRARVDGDRVVEYQIVAPTEWNFHPQGALARALDGLAADDTTSLERQARLAVQALDPCVPCRIEVGHA